MARSTYVYALMLPSIRGPIATFTVKRELRGYLTRLLATQPSVIPALSLFRMDDGPGGMRAEMSVQDVIDGK